MEIVAQQHAEKQDENEMCRCRRRVGMLALAVVGCSGSGSCTLGLVRSGLRFFTATTCRLQPAMPRLLSLAADSMLLTPANLHSLTRVTSLPSASSTPPRSLAAAHQDVTPARGEAWKFAGAEDAPAPKASGWLSAKRELRSRRKGLRVASEAVAKLIAEN